MWRHFVYAKMWEAIQPMARPGGHAMLSLTEKRWGIPFWLYLSTLPILFGISVLLYGWTGLPLDQAPFGFRMPPLLVSFALIVLVEGTLAAATAGSGRAEHAGRAVAVCGWALLGNHLFPVVLAGVAIGLVGTLVIPALHGSIVRER